MVTKFGRLVCSAAAAALCAVLLTPARPATGAEARLVVAGYADALGTANPGLSVAARRDMAERLLLLASYYRIDARLLAALVTVESSWHVRATSSSGALGLGQLMPATAATLDVDPREPWENLDGTARYLRRLLARYAERDPLTQMRLAVASYNAGPDAVARFGDVPPYRETRVYVAAVMGQWRNLALRLPLPPAAVWYDPPPTMRVAMNSNSTRPAPPASQTRRTVRQRPLVAPVRRRNVLHALRARKRHAIYRHYVVALEPNLVAETVVPVQWQTSHSFFARLLGLRHRVVGSVAHASVHVEGSAALYR